MGQIRQNTWQAATTWSSRCTVMPEQEQMLNSINAFRRTGARSTSVGILVPWIPTLLLVALLTVASVACGGTQTL